jgi:prophage maintenance system killer protein
MLEIHPRLQEDFDRWANQINEDPFHTHKTIGAIDILRAHYLIVDHFAQQGQGIGGVGPRDLNLLFSTLGRQVPSFGKITKWSDDLDICATLFFGLIKNHVFYDGNKRTAFLTLLFHLWKIGRVPDTRQRDFENLAVRIASNSLNQYTAFESYEDEPDAEIRFISHFLRRNTREINRRNYMITYRELNAILHKFDYFLANTSKHHIDVFRKEEEYYWELLKRKKRIVEKRIGVIAFPGWTREVGKSEIDKIRQITQLTAERGIDSEVFFNEASPLSALIDRYNKPLERLADK